MKNILKAFGVIAFVAIMGFSMVSCKDTTNDDKSDEESSSDFGYSETENGNSITITGYKGAEGNVIIPSKIKGKPVTSIGNGAFRNCTSLTGVTIPNSVTSIQTEAFYCTSLTSVTIPESVTSIGMNAFTLCDSLISVTFLGMNTSAYMAFDYGLHHIYYDGGIGTYTRGNDFGWMKQ
jgi:hypothetical protein